MNDNQILPTEKPAKASLQTQPGPALRILLADDEPLIRRLNTEVLVGSGYQVDVAEDGAVAWEALQQNGYDLLITDNNMPNVTGLDLLKKLHAARMALPVIMATGTFPRDEFTRQPWLVPVAMLLKPYAIAELLGTVQEVLRASNRAAAPRAPLLEATAGCWFKASPMSCRSSAAL
jgi:DNA-binding response OmpR family regulator